jgi:hypothetical protein
MQILRVPSVNKKSQKIIKENIKYVPIEKRAVELHRQHLLEINMNENKKEKKKKEEEEKEYEIVKFYNNNKKTFNEKDWEAFLKKQECKRQYRKVKAKAEEIIRNIISVINTVPEISLNSQKIIRNMRKKNTIKDVYSRLFDEFDSLQEKKRERIYNSMPSFKPLVNKNFNRHLFQNKKSNDKTRNNFDKNIESYKSKKSNKAININLNKYNQMANKSFFINSNNSGLKSSFSNFVFNSNSLKNNINNRKVIYENTYFDSQSQYSNKYKGSKSQSLFFRSTPYNRKKNNTNFFNNQSLNDKKNFFENKKNNSVIY